MTSPLVLRNDVDGIAVLTLNNPEKRNALSLEMLRALQDHLGAIASDTAVRVVIIAANGPVFSAGHDLRELIDRQRQDYETVFRVCTEVMEGIRLLPQPVIAQVQGLATAAGCQLAATCDLVMASEEAAFATPGVKIGLFCTTPAVALSRAVSSKKAMEMLLTGTPIGAREAERIGLVNRVVAPDRLAQETLDLARKISAASPRTLALGKRAFYEQLPLDHSSAYRLAGACMVENALTPDAQQGIAGFLKKPPR